ncbi:MAG: urease accessory protein UreE [Cyanobacteria bacterium P01_F01_bin.150]
MFSDISQKTTNDASPFVFTQILPGKSLDHALIRGSTADRAIQLALSLTAEERTKSRHYFEAQLKHPLDQNYSIGRDSGAEPAKNYGIYLRLPRGKVLQHGDYLITESKNAILSIQAKPEAVMTAIAPDSLTLLKATYHLGNRHVFLEVSLNYLRFSPDPVLKHMLEHMGLSVTEEISQFYPEAGVYLGQDSRSTHHH